ncbi:hypothetical protein JMUB7557_27660 [Staphylococcus aureus]
MSRGLGDVYKRQVHYRITRVRITDGDLHIVGETMLVPRQVFIGKHPVLTVFIFTTVATIDSAGHSIVGSGRCV